jgi:lysyl-tRNA synthetase, class I
MFWADKVAKEAKARVPIFIRDEKTVSGRVHVGSMRGVAIHGAINEVLNQEGTANVFKYEFNDFDPMDDIPSYLDRAKFEEHLGKPLKHVPSPDASAGSYAEYFANDFKSVIVDSGFAPEFYYGSELYESGKMDEAIKIAIEHAADIRRIYKEVSGGERKDTWLPVNVICPTCRKVTTTDATEWDGETVLVNCYPTKVDYTKGCGFEGRVSPYGGKAKLPWKVEWPAKWFVLGVTVEGAGKDHSTRGGSRDVAVHIAKDVFNIEPPLDAPYEFLLVGGKKMSSSKGRGSSAREIADLVPPKIFRLALLGKEIPVLYDQYDKLFEGYKTVKGDDYAKLFELIHPGKKLPAESAAFPRFSQVAFVVQMPHMDLHKEFPDADRAELEERAEYAKRWIELCAPKKFVFKLQDALPEAAKGFTAEQKQKLAQVADFVESTKPSAEDLHAKLHELKAFKEIYQAFLAKESGPKAGWFLSALPTDFAIKRLREASKL